MSVVCLCLWGTGTSPLRLPKRGGLWAVWYQSREAMAGVLVKRDWSRQCAGQSQWDLDGWLSDFSESLPPLKTR